MIERSPFAQTTTTFFPSLLQCVVELLRLPTYVLLHPPGSYIYTILTRLPRFSGQRVRPKTPKRSPDPRDLEIRLQRERAAGVQTEIQRWTQVKPTSYQETRRGERPADHGEQEGRAREGGRREGERGRGVCLLFSS